MSAVYLVDKKEVKTKNGERLVISLLCKDGYGNPAVRQFWLPADSDVAQSADEIMVGSAVRLNTVFGNERSLAFIEENPNPVILDLTDFHKSDFV